MRPRPPRRRRGTSAAALLTALRVLTLNGDRRPSTWSERAAAYLRARGAVR